jgi:hypothetical protein
MTESVRTLWKTDSQPHYYRAPIARLLDDGSQYTLWESYHGRQMREVADCPRQAQQAIALRKVAVNCIHRRGLLDYLRVSHMDGDSRRKLLEVFYGPVDYHDSLSMEHRQYVLAAASGYCAEGLINTINDSGGVTLLERYQHLYAQYFEIFSQYMQADYLGAEELAGALRPTMLEYRSYANRVRRQILVQPRMRLPFSASVARRPDRTGSSATLR